VTMLATPLQGLESGADGPCCLAAIHSLDAAYTNPTYFATTPLVLDLALSEGDTCIGNHKCQHNGSPRNAEIGMTNQSPKSSARPVVNPP
jgi:hypothetical protein